METSFLSPKCKLPRGKSRHLPPGPSLRFSLDGTDCSARGQARAPRAASGVLPDVTHRGTHAHTHTRTHFGCSSPDDLASVRMVRATGGFLSLALCTRHRPVKAGKPALMQAKGGSLQDNLYRGLQDKPRRRLLCLLQRPGTRAKSCRTTKPASGERLEPDIRTRSFHAPHCFPPAKSPRAGRPDTGCGAGLNVSKGPWRSRSHPTRTEGRGAQRSWGEPV